MARSRSRGGRSAGAGRGRATAAKAQKATSRKKAPAVAAVEVVEEEPGSGIDDGIAIVTTIVLLVAIVFADLEMGRHYGAGLLFKGSYEAPQGG